MADLRFDTDSVPLLRRVCQCSWFVARRPTTVTVTRDAAALTLAQRRADACRISAPQLWAKLDARGEAVRWDPRATRALRFDPGLRTALLARVGDTGVSLEARWAALRLAEEAGLEASLDATFRRTPDRASALYTKLLTTATPEERAEVYERHAWFPGDAALHRIAADLHCPHAPTARGALQTLERMRAPLSLRQLEDLEAHPAPIVAQAASQARRRLYPRLDELQEAADELRSTDDVHGALRTVHELRDLSRGPASPSPTASGRTSTGSAWIGEAMATFCQTRLAQTSPTPDISGDTWTLPVTFALYALQDMDAVPQPLEAQLLALPDRHQFRHYGLLALARRRGAAALESIGDDPRSVSRSLGDMLQTIAERHPASAPLVLERLAAAAWDALGYRAAVRTCMLLGAPGRALLETQLDRLPRRLRAHATWEFAGHTCMALAKRLDALGALDPGWQARIDCNGVTGTFALEEALRAGNRAMTFDRETGQVPVAHDNLLVRIARLTAGAVAPRVALERYLEPDATQAYTVEFIADDTLYTFHPRDCGDFYDVEAVVTALNIAVENAGRSERLIVAPSGDSSTTVLWLDEAVARTISDEFELELIED